MTDLTPDQQQILKEAITDFNDTLVTQSINLSGQAFNNAFRLGCGLLLLPLIIVLVATYIVRGALDFSGVFVFSCAGVAIAVVFASLVSNRAKYLAVQEKYQKDVNPDIVKFLAGHGFTRAQFDAAADDLLADNAPLREYLIQRETP
jgi:Na+/H+ antiporter NhaC